MPQDITPQMDMVSSTPQEAAEHIDNSNVFGIGADVFKDYKSELQPQVDQMSRPTEASDTVAKYVAQSPEHAALAAPDVEKLSVMDRQWKLIGDFIGKRRTTDEQIIENNLKKIWTPEKYTQEDELKLDQLNTDASGFSNYGLDGPYEQIPAQIAGGIASIGSGLLKHADLIAGATTAGAVIGAGGGLVATGPLAPIGAAAGAVGGAATGATYGALAALTIDGVNQQMGATYNELGKLKDANGQPIQGLDDTAKRNISIGVGVATGAIIAVVGKTVAKSVPFLNNLIGPKAVATVVMDPAKEALKRTIFNVGEAVIASGGGAGLQKAIEVISSEFAKTYDGTEASYLNALSNASDQIKQSAIVGAGVGALISGPSAALGHGQMKKNFIQAEEQRFSNSRDVTPDTPTALQPPPSDIPPKGPRSGGTGHPAVDAAVDVLHFDAALDQIKKVGDSTDMKNISPAQLSQVRQLMIQNAEIGKVYADKEDLTKFANNAEKAKAVRDIIDPSGQAAAALNAPAAFEPHEFMDLYEKYPEIGEIVKLSPEGPNVQQATKFLEEHKAAQEKRTEILTKLGAADIDPAAKETLTQALETEQPSRLYPSVFGEEEYLKQPTFTQAIEGVLGEKEVKSFNDAQLAARQSVVDNINESAKYEMDEIKDFTLEQARDVEKENQLTRLENNPNLAIVDRFANPDPNFADLAVGHKKQGYSAFAIDPKSLPVELQEKYLNNEQLKNHKVFVKGGIPAQDAAALLGLRDADTLLNILSQTPSREQVAEARVKAREADLQQQVNDSVDLNKTAIAEAYNNVAKNHIAEMKFMKEKQWPATKGGIKRIALPLPKIQDLTVKARKAVSNMKVEDLNVNQFKVGERKSQRIAIQSILKNEVEKAFVNKEAAALNAELVKETHVAIGEMNRAFKFIRRMKEKSNQQELKDAGKLYVDAHNEIIDTFNLDPDKKGQSEQGAYLKFVQKMIEQGNGDFQIPESLSDVRQSVYGMTVDQVRAVTDRLKNILHMAKYKNRLYAKHEKIKGLQTMEALGSKVEAVAQANPHYDPKRAANIQETSKSWAEKKGETLKGWQNTTQRAQHIIFKFDGAANGLLNDLAWQPMVQAGNHELSMNIEVYKHLNTMIEKFGKEDFGNLATEMVTVPEFKNVKTIKNGKVSKAQLLAMELNFGNDGNLEALERFGVDRQTIRSVLDRELEHRHTEFAQGVWDIFESFKPKVGELQKRTEGTDVQWVEPTPFVARGRAYPGGYYRIVYAPDRVRSAAEKAISAAEVTQTEKFIQKYYAKSMTAQGHLMERVGSDRLLDLDMHRLTNAITQVTHDLAFREPVRDTQKVLTDKKIANSIVSVVGKDGYENILDMVNDSANSVEEVGNRTDQQIQGFLNELGGGIQTVAIAGKITSILVQPSSIAFGINKMGNVSGTKYFLKAVYKYLSNPGKIGDMIRFAEEIMPDLKAGREDMEGNANANLRKLLPTKKTPYLSPIKAGQEWIVEKSFAAIGAVDAANKSLMSVAAYMQAIDGEAPGVEGGNHEAAKKYAANIVELTQTTNNIRNLSPIQKKKYMKWALYFYNDLNNMLNNSYAVADKAKAEFSQSGSAASKGDWKTASKFAGAGVSTVAGYLLILSLVKFYENGARGKPNPFGEDATDDPQQFLKDVAKFYLGSPTEILDGIPFARDVKFATGKYWEKRKEVDMPIDSALGTFATAYVGLENMLDSEKAVSSREYKEIFKTVGILTKMPTDAIYSYFIKPDYELPPVIKGQLERVSNSIEGFLKRNEDNSQVSQQFKDELKTIQNQLNPQKTATVPENSLDVLRMALSKGNNTAYNEATGAAGAYQFTEQSWKYIKENAPDLGLTDNGRTSSDSTQQERAMDWENELNAKYLKAADLEVNNESLLASHLLGFADTIKVLRASGDMKLKTLVGEKFIEQNNFKNSFKVRDFKDWLSQQVMEGENSNVARSANN